MRGLVAFALVVASSVNVESQVRVWEEDVVIPTYPLGPDDVNPHFYELEGSVIYPYTMQDNLTTEKIERSYRAWYLENEYLKLMALPELGGRIQYVHDKRRGEPMFYHNRVIRPGLIALRGAWVSGGIEWNRGPTGHTVTSFSPVDVVGVSNDDGSATLVIGNTEMNFRTGWEVRLTLHPRRTFLDEEIALYNPTDGFHPYYFWNNTAFPNRPGTRFIYPMTLGSDHDGVNFFSWPVHEGRDLTWLRNYPEPTSVFAYRCVFDFFGAYDVDRDYGIVQVSNHHEHPGKKAWTWGEADSGLMSQSVLTDEDGPYIEVQSGPLLTQADFAMLAPGQEVRWREFWYPVFDLKDGFEYATKDVAVQRVDSPDGVEFRIHASGHFDQARLRIGDAEVIRNLGPEATESVMTSSKSVSVSIHHDGRELLSYRSPLDIPLERAPQLEAHWPVSTAEDAYLRGQDHDLRMERGRAREWYEHALTIDPSHHDSLVALAVIDLESGRVDAATARLDRAIDRDPEKGMAHYLAGVAALRTGDLDAALAHGYAAASRHGTRALGLGVVGRALMRQHRFREAREAFEQAYSPGGSDHQRLFDSLLIATWAAGERRDAVRMARRALNDGSTRLAPRAILFLEMRDDLSEALAVVGEDEFGFIELALAFAELGLTEAAASLLEAARLGTRPLPLYYLAFWTPPKAAEYLERASKLSHDYVFPSRPETVPVLVNAIEHRPDAKTYLALGNLYAGLGRLDEARHAWVQAASRDPRSSVAHRNLAMADWKLDHDLDAAAKRFEKAIAARASDQTLHRDLGRLRLEQGRATDAMTLLAGMESQGRRRADVTLLLARAYVEAHRFDDAIELLAATTFSNREGDSGTWSLFSRAHVDRGSLRFDEGRYVDALQDFEAALTYPANLNVGRPAQPLEARALYWKGRSLAALNRAAAARAAWTECAANPPSTDEQTHFIEECRNRLAP
jgi:tetratricopeptide (TPR) repeat protein